MENANKKSLLVDGTRYETGLTKKYLRRKPYTPKDPKKFTAFIPGVIHSLFVKAGDSVKKGDPLLILEAMKMKNRVTAHDDVKIKAVHIVTGQRVAKEELLLEFE
ncbi:MAG: acetyl-CoA carboxylase biotin carboxyl carrier protein subunit [Ignavibacteriaceae bacterium]|nr:acetyl-CoA carboxylase biotin carboxyl carrier protein subunit [Ignavibacteriaceae bacterium]